MLLANIIVEVLKYFALAYVTVVLGVYLTRRACVYESANQDGPSSFFGYMYGFSFGFIVLPLWVPMWILILGTGTPARWLIVSVGFLLYVVPFIIAKKDSYRAAILERYEK